MPHFTAPKPRPPVCRDRHLRPDAKGRLMFRSAVPHPHQKPGRRDAGGPLMPHLTAPIHHRRSPRCWGGVTVAGLGVGAPTVGGVVPSTRRGGVAVAGLGVGASTAFAGVVGSGFRGGVTVVGAAEVGEVGA